MDFKEFKHFNSNEFDSPDLKGSGSTMNIETVRKLHKARLIADVPFVINSGVRTISHNKKVGGVSNSSHLYGYAVDIRVRNNKDRYIILSALMDVGFNRFGIGKYFIHVDDDPNKPSNLIWDYMSKQTLK